MVDGRREELLFFGSVPEPLAAAGTDDPLRDQLLDAAAAVFARQGFAGAKIQDIVREAGLSTGAVYGRFASKQDLLREAVVRRTANVARPNLDDIERVAELITRVASIHTAPLSDVEAVRVEAYVTARREPDVATAIADAQTQWRAAVQPLVDVALEDGTVAAGVDPEAVLYFLRTVHLGLLLQRGAGIDAPDPAAWNDLINRIVASFGAGGTDTRSTK
jgi:AcrR family transcriptional regulator